MGRVAEKNIIGNAYNNILFGGSRTEGEVKTKGENDFREGG